MGNCSSQLDCAKGQTVIDADPDIAGIGVLASFMITAFLTLLAILWGYFSDALPRTALNRFDHLVIKKVSCFLHFSDDVTQDPGAVHRKHAEALKRFILALSDQQLVTGLAVLIAGFSERCSMATYHFNIVAALAWFSSTTHLSTLVVLREYFVQHTLVRTWRVIGMLIMLAMLFVSQLVVFTQGYTEGYITLPTQCVFRRLTRSRIWLPLDDQIGLAAVMIFLFVSYFNRLLGLYSNDPSLSIFGWFGQQFSILFENIYGVRPPPHGNGNTAGQLETTWRGNSKHLRELQRDHWLVGWLRHYVKGTRNNYFTRLECSLCVYVFVAAELRESFFWHIIWLAFGNAYGITQIVAARWTWKPEQWLKGDSNEMRFGQLVSILLIALPILAGGEAFYETRYASKGAPSASYRDTSIDLPVPDRVESVPSSQMNHGAEGVSNADQTDTTSNPAVPEPIRPIARADTESGLLGNASIRSSTSDAPSTRRQSIENDVSDSLKKFVTRIPSFKDLEEQHIYDGPMVSCIVFFLIGAYLTVLLTGASLYFNPKLWKTYILSALVAFCVLVNAGRPVHLFLRAGVRGFKLVSRRNTGVGK